MQQFLIVAAAHFLALLSPGPDFFLVTRTSGTAALRPESALFVTLQLVGCAYLLYLGVLFIRCAGANVLDGATAQPARTPEPSRQAMVWWRAAGMGFLSGILNPKNALFYASLAAMLTGPHASIGWKTLYGAWMFSIVLLWDLLVAVMIGNQAVLQRFARALPCLERISGIVLVVLALSVLAALLIC